MFVGMEHIILSNFALADEALHAANTLCDGDPLLMNECGVMAYNHGESVYHPRSMYMFYDTNHIYVAIRGQQTYSSKPSTWRVSPKAQKRLGVRHI